MSVEIVPIAPPLYPEIHRFASRTWVRPETPEFLEWRYARCPTLTGYVAMREGQCVAMATGFLRTYRIGERDLDVRESFDWFCLPEYRRTGLGVRVMQRMMKDREAITVIGGTADTRDLLPRLGFSIPGQLRSFVLPLGPERIAERLEARRVPRSLTRAAFRVVGPLLFSPVRIDRPGSSAVPVATLGPEIEGLYRRARRKGTVPLWRLDHFEWIAHGFPGLGHHLPFYFCAGDDLLGWALLRVSGSGAARVARVLELYTPEPEEERIAWMVSELARAAAGYAPDYLTAQTTSETVARALARNRFREMEAQPIHFWSGVGDVLEEPLDFGGSWGDAPILPYPERWWSA